MDLNDPLVCNTSYCFLQNDVEMAATDEKFEIGLVLEKLTDLFADLLSID